VSRELLFIKDVAAILGCNRHDVSEYARVGRIVATKLPGAKRLRFTREAVDAFIASCQVGPIDGPIEESEPVQVVAKPARLRRTTKQPVTVKPLWYERYAAK
jgi:excisionase family DNA binding protein